MKLKTKLSESLTRKGLACKDLLPDANASGLGELFQDCLNISKNEAYLKFYGQTVGLYE